MIVKTATDFLDEGYSLSKDFNCPVLLDEKGCMYIIIEGRLRDAEDTIEENIFDCNGDIYEWSPEAKSWIKIQRVFMDTATIWISTCPKCGNEIRYDNHYMMNEYEICKNEKCKTKYYILED